MTNSIYTPAKNGRPATITVILKGEQYTLDDSHPNFKRIKYATSHGKDDDYILNLVDVPRAVEKMAKGNVSVVGNDVQYKGKSLRGPIVARILASLQDKHDNIDHLINFIERLHMNPDARVHDDLYAWLETSKLPICNDGCFLAWKIVNPDYKDLRTRTISYKVGDMPVMDRNAVDPDPYRTCSSGLHFCSWEYLDWYGGRDDDKNHIMLVKVAPEDVVAIPNDHNSMKGRTWKMLVVDEHKGSTKAEEPKMPSRTHNYHNVRDQSGRFTKKGA